MAVYYADSSVLIKRQIAEVGTEWVRGLTKVSSQNRIITAQITPIEGLSALNRRVREGVLTSAEYAESADAWLTFCSTSYQLIALSPQIVNV